MEKYLQMHQELPCPHLCIKGIHRETFDVQGKTMKTANIFSL